MRLYVGTYRKYNNGSLEGAWLDPMNYDSYEDFIEACKELHKDEEDPEIMFQDFDGEDYGMYSEHSFSEDFWNVLKASEEVSDDDAFKAFMNCFGEISIRGMDSDEIVDMFNEKYFGQFDSDEDLGYYLAEECDLLHGVPEDIARYFDYEAYGRDCAYDFYEDSGYYFYS